MNIFSIIYLLNVFSFIKSEYETIKLKYEEDEIYIPVKLGNKYDTTDIKISTMLPINIFPSTECSQCKSNKINIQDNNFTLIQEYVSILYYSLNFTGNLYRTNITLGTETNLDNFIAINKIYDIDEYSQKGVYSLSFLNYYYNTSNKTFAIYLDNEYGELHLGGYDKDKITDKNNLKIFNIYKTNNSLENIFNNFWYINFDSFHVDTHKFENSDFKITFDLSTNYFHIPKNFFFDNAQYFFPEKAKCQIQPEGYFVCLCNEDYEKTFYTFEFMNKNANQSVKIKPSDYVFFENSKTDNYCFIYIVLNYDNELFIAGKNIMINYYSIFDISEEKLKLYPSNIEKEDFSKERNFIISLVLLLAGIFLFLCCYLIYRRWFSNNQNENENNFDDNFDYEGINWDEIDNQDNENREPNIEDTNNEQNNNTDNNIDNENKDNENNDNIEDKKEEEIIDDNDDIKDDNAIVYGGRESNIIN